MLGKKQKKDFDRTVLHQVKAKPMKGPGIPASLGLRKALPPACQHNWGVLCYCPDASYGECRLQHGEQPHTRCMTLKPAGWEKKCYHRGCSS